MILRKISKKCDIVLIESPKEKPERYDLVINPVYDSMYIWDKNAFLHFDRIDAKVYHIYILSDDQLKVDDWVVDTKDNTLKIVSKENHVDTMKKVIGTTDPALSLLPLKKEFINDLIETYNDRKNYEFISVQYEENVYFVCGDSGFGEEGFHLDIEKDLDGITYLPTCCFEENEPHVKGEKVYTKTMVEKMLSSCWMTAQAEVHDKKLTGGFARFVTNIFRN